MSQSKRTAALAAGVVVVLVAALVLVWALRSDDDTTAKDTAGPGASTSSGATESATSQAAEERTGDGEQAPAAAAAGEFGLGVGDPEAPVKVEIFADFQCPHCKHFHEAGGEKLLAAAADGSAYVVHRPMAFLNDYSGRALNAFGVVLDAAGGQVALDFMDLLWANQPMDATLTDEDLVGLAVKAGAPEGEVRTGILEQVRGQWVIDASTDAADRGVTGTPTIFVNGESVSGASIEELVENTMEGIAAG